MTLIITGFKKFEGFPDSRGMFPSVFGDGSSYSLTPITLGTADNPTVFNLFSPSRYDDDQRLEIEFTYTNNTGAVVWVGDARPNNDRLREANNGIKAVQPNETYSGTTGLTLLAGTKDSGGSIRVYASDKRTVIEQAQFSGWYGFVDDSSPTLTPDMGSPSTGSKPDTGGKPGTAGNNTFTGTAGNDTLLGLGGNDKLTGAAGNDFLKGGDGKDQLFGGAGNDKLWGGTGNDVLKGDQGRDVFALERGLGQDGIKDFNDRQDKLGLTGGMRFKDLTITQRGSSVLVRAGNDQLAILTGMRANQITAADFSQMGLGNPFV